MVTVSGRLLDFVEDPSQVAQVQVRAREVRPHGDGVMLDHPVKVDWDPSTGTVSFDAAAGTAGVIVWHSVGRSHTSGSLPLVVPEGDTATLRECVEAALLADEGTLNELERLALEVTGMVATIQNITQLEEWATDARDAAGRAEGVIEATSWEGDRLTVHGKTSPSLTGPRGPQGIQGIPGPVLNVTDSSQYVAKSYVDAQKWYRGSSATMTITSVDDLPHGTVEILNAALAGDLGLPVANPGVIETHTMGASRSGYQRWLSQKNMLPTEHVRRRSSTGWGAWEVVNKETIDSKADTEYVDGLMASKMDAYPLDSVLGVGPDLAEDYAGRVVQLNHSGQLVLNTESITSPKSPINRDWAETSLGGVYVQQKSGLRYVDDWLSANGYGRFHEGVQACIDTAPVNSTLIFSPNFTYNLQDSGPLVIPRKMTLAGGTFRTETGKVFYTEADGVTLQDMRLYGHQAITPDTYKSGANMVEFRGASGASRIKATIRNLRVERVSHEAISLHYVRDFTVENCDIEDFNYGAIMVYCGNDGIIRGNRIKNGVAGTNMDLVYGIELSDLDATEATRCRRVLVTENLVEDIPLWEGIDSHGGMEITISNNMVRRCKHGVVITVGSLSNRTTAPEKIIITGNHVSGGDLSFTTGISIGGGDLGDGTILTADCLVTGNHVADTTMPINIPPARAFLTSRTVIEGNVGHGDTGWRNIDDMVAGRTGGSVYVRRTEDLIHIHFDGLAIAPESNPFWFTLFTLPEGMRPQFTIHMRMDMGAGVGAGDRYISMNLNGEFRINYPQNHSGAMWGYLTIAPKDLTWPVTLPGTPA